IGIILSIRPETLLGWPAVCIRQLLYVAAIPPRRVFHRCPVGVLHFPYIPHVRHPPSVAPDRSLKDLDVPRADFDQSSAHAGDPLSVSHGGGRACRRARQVAVVLFARWSVAFSTRRTAGRGRRGGCRRSHRPLRLG